METFRHRPQEHSFSRCFGRCSRISGLELGSEASSNEVIGLFFFLMKSQGHVKNILLGLSRRLQAQICILLLKKLNLIPSFVGHSLESSLAHADFLNRSASPQYVGADVSVTVGTGILTFFNEGKR